MPAADESRVGQSPADELAELLEPAWPASAHSGAVDEQDDAESPELPGAELPLVPDDELAVAALPQQADEFVCARCHLIQHRSRVARSRCGALVCRDCL